MWIKFQIVKHETNPKAYHDIIAVVWLPIIDTCTDFTYDTYSKFVLLKLFIFFIKIKLLQESEDWNEK